MGNKDLHILLKEINSEKEAILDYLNNRLTELENMLSGIVQILKEKIDRDEAKKKLIENIIVQLENYQKDFIFEKFQKKIFLDTIQLFDRIDTIKHDIPKEYEIFIKHLESLQIEVLQILKRQGVERIKKTSKRFNEEFQEVIGQEFTSNPEDDNIIIRVEKNGFKYQNKLLRPEMVVIAKYKIEGEQNGKSNRN